MYWGSNPLAASSSHFYLTRQVLFEPIGWLGIAALLAARLHPAVAWVPIRATWLWLFLFLTVWGNYQLRYGVVLVAWEHLGAVALLTLPQPGNRSSQLAGVLGAAWLLGTFARSLWILYASAAHNDFFYF